ncbi:hypothetical protein J4437_03135 [Candidatus Woesearchaeota archaeon]|nr:hypothetical protein [Candidatus Woesearchaeota archaeon]
MLNKKGEALSINVIIITVLALVVLVVLIMVFTGRITIFQQGVSKESQTALLTMKIGYGQCQPSASDESTFTKEFAAAESAPDAEEQARSNFKEVISRCKALSDDKTTCESSACTWG